MTGHDRKLHLAGAPPPPCRLENLVTSVSSLIVFDRVSRRCLWANEAALRIYGYSHGEMNGRLPNSLCAPGHFSSVMDRSAEGARASTTTLHRRKDGSDFDADETVFDSRGMRPKR